MINGETMLKGSDLLQTRNWPLLDHFNNDALFDLALRGNSSIDDMRYMFDARGEDNINAMLARVDIVNAERNLRLEQNRSIVGFPEPPPKGQYSVIDSLRLQILQTDEETRRINDIIYNAATDGEVAQWTSIMDKNYNPLETSNTDSVEKDIVNLTYEDTPDPTDTDSDWDDYNAEQDALHNRRNQALERRTARPATAQLDRPVQGTVVREQRATRNFRTTPDDRHADKDNADVTISQDRHPVDNRDGVGPRFSSLIKDIFESIRVEILYSPRRNAYMLLIGAVQVILIILLFKGFYRCCCSRPTPRSIHDEELQVLQPTTTNSVIYKPAQEV